MNKIDFIKLNRSNNDIWAALKLAVEKQNFAMIEASLSRLHALQSYYIRLLNFQDMEINQLKDIYKNELQLRESFEKEWLIEVSKKAGLYENLKERINETYK